MKKKILCVIMGLFLLSVNVQAQKDSIIVTENQEVIKLYEVTDIEITGDNKYTVDQIGFFTNIKKGDFIQIPGNSISVAIKKIWTTNLFSDIQVFVTPIDEKKIKLRYNIIGFPVINEINIIGLSKSKTKDIIKDLNLKEGKTITPEVEKRIQNYVANIYEKKGFPEPTVEIEQQKLENNPNKKNITVKINKGPRVKIKSITISGNNNIKSKKILTKALKKSRIKSFNPIKKSKLIDEDYKAGLQEIESLYKSIGYRDIKVTEEKVTKIDKKNYGIKIIVDEGKRYYIGKVDFLGNSAYTTDILKKVFAYDSGDAYDAVGINKKISGSEKDDDLQTLYLDNGYLFANIQADEVGISGDSINLKITIREGEKARYNKITFTGNNVTYDRVIVRELRTKPGDLFSKSNLKRTYFSLSQLGFFDPQGITYDLNPNPQNNTVDLNWKLTEKSSSQIELQGGYGGNALVGTLGLNFNNFSVQNLFKKDAWRPIPQGSGQRLSLRAQAGNGFQNYSLSFTEPWIGGKTPTSLSTGISHTFQDFAGASSNNSLLNTQLRIYTGNVGLNKLLSWPDDYFSLSQNITYQYFSYKNYLLNTAENNLYTGSSNNLNYTIQLNRRSQGPDAIFPTSGSDFEILLKLTPPYSLFNNKDYSTASNIEKYKWLEYYKIKTHAYWYQEIIGKLVLKVGGEFGFLNAYNRDLGISPFERYYMGGSGLAVGRIDGREIITLRGYVDPSASGGETEEITPLGGGVTYNKFMMEFRYPITMGNSAKIWALTFFEAGNIWGSSSDFNPFNLKKSAGFGVRVFMPAFGLLGLDLGYGFDTKPFSTGISGQQIHFIIGQQF